MKGEKKTHPGGSAGQTLSAIRVRASLNGEARCVVALLVSRLERV